MTNPADSKSPERDIEPLDASDAAFVSELAARYAPEPLSEAGRRDFDRALASRLESPHPTRRSLPIFAAAAAVAVWAVIAVPTLFVEPEPSSVPNRAEAFAAAEWESQLFDTVGYGAPGGYGELDGYDDLDDLPDDYAAIAGLLLDG